MSIPTTSSTSNEDSRPHNRKRRLQHFQRCCTSSQSTGSLSSSSSSSFSFAHEEESCRKTVRFQEEMRVLEFETVLGDHPSCCLPLQLGWRVESDKRVPIHENCNDKNRTTCVPSQQDVKQATMEIDGNHHHVRTLSLSDRIHILQSQGYSSAELLLASTSFSNMGATSSGSKNNAPLSLRLYDFFLGNSPLLNAVRLFFAVFLFLLFYRSLRWTVFPIISLFYRHTP